MAGGEHPRPPGPYPRWLPSAAAPRWEAPSSLSKKKKKKLASPHICKVKAQKAFYKPKPLFSRAYSFTN